MSTCGQSPWRLGVVSYLNARPLICGLENDPAVRLCFDVPSRLAERLAAGEFDAALLPVIDVLDSDLRIISDACIASEGETLTVRVFSRVPPRDVARIHVDTDSRTSVALLKLIWPQLYGRVVPHQALCRGTALEQCQTVLLIGDKVVSTATCAFRYQVDLGGAWKAWTGLPFVFAVWAAPRPADMHSLGRVLSAARDRGARNAGQLAVEHGPAHGWSPQLAQQYLERYLCFGLTDRHVEGMIRFLDLVQLDRGLASKAQLELVP